MPKFQRELVASLRKRGLRVLEEAVFKTGGQRADIVVPKLNTVVEVQGGHHDVGVYGDARLHYQLELDARKRMHLVAHGVNIVEVKIGEKGNTAPILERAIAAILREDKPQYQVVK